MAQIASINKIVNGTLGTSSPINQNFANIKAVYNAHDTATTGVHNIGTDSIGDSSYLETLIDLCSPVGTVLDVWRPTEITFDIDIDEDIFAIMDGSTVSDADSLFNTVDLPDMTNRYFIGMGTENGEDMLSDSSSMETPIGTAGHLIGVSHLNTFPDHTHSHNHGSTHTHNGQTTASSGIRMTSSLWSLKGFFNQKTPTPQSTSYNRYVNEGNSTVVTQTSSSNVVPLTVFSTDSFFLISSTETVSNTTSANNTSVYTGTGTDFDIQPSSLAVRRYIRYK
jgi:hypothetical protein